MIKPRKNSRNVPGDIISFYRSKLAGEEGNVIKDWGSRLSVALVYPNFYRLGMSNLGFQIIYSLLNNRPDVVAERVFLPDDQEMSLYSREGRPLLSLESQTPLQKFELIAFSLSFENDYPNILKILELGKIPLLAENRAAPRPFIMAGGVTTFMNPEPLAPFVDFFLLGEAESNLHDFIELFLEFSPECLNRNEFFKRLAGNISTLYVPSLYQAEYNKDGTLKSFLPKVDLIPEKIKVGYLNSYGSIGQKTPHSTITTPATEFADKVLIELGRGCGRSCRFCAAGYVYRPPRVYEESDLAASIEKVMETNNKVGLLAPAVSDVRGIENLTSLILKKGGRFSVSSLRADSITQSLLENLKKAGQKTLSIAPEAGSERLRRVINKHLTTEQIIDTVSLISKIRDFAIRLYFLIGIPTETNEDMTELVGLVRTIKHHMIKESASRGRIGRIRLSVNCFVPKPFTPFQWAGMEQLKSLKEKQKWLKKTLVKEGGIKVNSDIPKWSYVQTLLSMGDRRVGSILLGVHKFGGNWTKALRFSDVNPDFFVYRPKDIDEVLPWDFIDHGIRKKHLVKEYKLALKTEESDSCHVGECHRCGICS
ncbi:MAG: radical SAM protein [Desulfobacterales bacterium]|nr:radical SAM protein [Desulfobacterales bacterium]